MGDKFDSIFPPTRIAKTTVNYMRQLGGMQLKIQTNLKDKDGLITKDLLMKNI